MGRWSKARDRASNQVQREVKRIGEDINAELKRFGQRLAAADDTVTTDSCQAQTTQNNASTVICEDVNLAPTTTVATNVTKVKSTPLNCNPLGLKPGLGFIINHKTFEDEQLVERSASELDVKRMEEVLASFHLSLKVIHDGTTSEVSRLMTEDSRNAYGQPTKTPDEILQFHSCVEGYVSYLMPTGSIFIEILCNQLTALGDTEDIRLICNTVIETVKKEIYDMQIPMLHTNLTKPFVLGHYKMRENLNT